MPGITRPGLIVLFGSGETSPSGRKVFELLLRGLPVSPRLAFLETPAGFELNSSQVICRIAEFIQHRLQNYSPRLTVVPARRKGTLFSPDDPQLVAPLLEADVIFMGPGSPSYAVRQLKDSLAWHYLVARHRLGGTLVLASAAAIAISAYSLPVYEIYKVGEDLHWKEGLDFFGMFGLPLIFIPHWNNNEGGDELDTSRCFMGIMRFNTLMEMLPSGITVLGIDENTALILDLQEGIGRVVGLGKVTLLRTGNGHHLAESGLSVDEGKGLTIKPEDNIMQFEKGQSFLMSECCPFKLPSLDHGLPLDVWKRALNVQEQLKEQQRKVDQSIPKPYLIVDAPKEVHKLVAERQEARSQKDWLKADDLRGRIKSLGWNIEDTAEGTRLFKK